jgi:hypothetical protein
MYESQSEAQHRYARLAGLMYLLNYLTATTGVLIPSRITGSGGFAEKAERVIASEGLYRAGLVSMLVSWVLIVALAYSLYVTLAPVNKRLSQIALFMELCQACIGAVTVVLSFMTLQIFRASAEGTFGAEQLDAFRSLTYNATGTGFHVAMTFLGVGSTIFFYLFYRSHYVPRLLAGWGIFASLVMIIVSLATLMVPEYSKSLQYGWGPMGIAELATAFWLMLRGIRITNSPIADPKPAI